MTDLCAQAIENMECQPEPGRGVGRGRARVSRALGGGTPPLRESRPEKPAQPLEKAQNRLGTGGRPKPRPGCAPGRSPCRPWSARNAGWGVAVVCGRTRVSRGLGGGTPPLRQSRPENWRNPLKRLKTGSGLAGGRSRDRVRSPCRPWSARNAGWGVAVVGGRTRVSRGLGGGKPPLRQSRPEKLAQPFEKAQNRLGLAGGRSRDRLRAGSIAVPSLVSSKRRLGVAVVCGRARVSSGLGGGTPPLRQSRPEKPAQALENAQNQLGSGGRPKPRPVRPGRRLAVLGQLETQAGRRTAPADRASGPDDGGESKKASEALEKVQNGLGNGKAAQSGTR